MLKSPWASMRDFLGMHIVSHAQLTLLTYYLMSPIPQVREVSLEVNVIQ